MKKENRVWKGSVNDSNIWIPYKVTLTFIGRLCGSVPASENVIAGWLESRKPSAKPPAGKTMSQINEEVINRLPDMEKENAEIQKRSTVIFERVEGRLAVRAATIRAHLKDCTSQVQNQLVGRLKGERNFTTRVKNGLYIGGGFRDESGTEMLFITKEGKPITEGDGFQERMVHASSPQGPINALKQFEYVIKPQLTFNVFLLGESVKIDPDLIKILQYGATHGYGGERSMQEGQYAFEIEEVKSSKELINA